MKSLIQRLLREDLTYHHASDATKDEFVIDEADSGPLTLYHGSQRKINTKEGFSTKYIKSGEGTNYFGWGLYFSDTPAVAMSYARNNTVNQVNRMISLATEFVGEDIGDIIDFFQSQGQWEDVPSEIRNLLVKNKDTGKRAEDLINKGYLYTVKVNPSKPKLFNWKTQNGEYKRMVKELGSDKAASAELYKKGYYGIEYPTGSFSGEHYDEGTNYVIFNDKDVNIVNLERL